MNAAQAVKSSISTEWNLEHIFAKVPESGDYELWVALNNFEGFISVDYALAWWAGADERTAPGDFNGDGSVNSADYVVWRNDPASFGGAGGYDMWQAKLRRRVG